MVLTEVTDDLGCGFQGQVSVLIWPPALLVLPASGALDALESPSRWSPLCLFHLLTLPGLIYFPSLYSGGLIQPHCLKSSRLDWILLC